MEIRFAPADLRRLDGIQSEALAMTFFEDERPPRGALGLIDLRLCGFLSRQLIAGRLSGRLDDMVLVPTRGRLSCDKLFVLGLGEREAFDGERYETVLGTLFSALSRAKVRSSVWSLPGRTTHAIGPGEAMERLLRVSQGFQDQDELTVLEGQDGQREMESVVLQEKRRLRAFE